MWFQDDGFEEQDLRRGSRCRIPPECCKFYHIEALSDTENLHHNSIHINSVGQYRNGNSEGETYRVFIMETIFLLTV